MGKDVLCEGGGKAGRQEGPREGKLSLDRHLQLAFCLQHAFFLVLVGI